MGATVQADAAEVLPVWSEHFRSAEFCRGTEVRLALSSGGGVATLIDGQTVRPVQTLSPARRALTITHVRGAQRSVGTAQCNTHSPVGEN